MVAARRPLPLPTGRPEGEQRLISLVHLLTRCASHPGLVPRPLVPARRGVVVGLGGSVAVGPTPASCLGHSSLRGGELLLKGSFLDKCLTWGLGV